MITCAKLQHVTFLFMIENSTFLVIKWTINISSTSTIKCSNDSICQVETSNMVIYDWLSSFEVNECRATVPLKINNHSKKKNNETIDDGEE